jgi:extracellular elastinolytic metalloproteinase
MRSHLGLGFVLVAASVLVGSLATISVGATAVSADSVAQRDLDPEDVALQLLASGSREFDLLSEDPAELVVVDVLPTEHNGLTHVYVQQQQDGIDIFGAVANVAVRDDGDVLAAVSSRSATIANDSAPAIDAAQAAESAASALGLVPTTGFEVLDDPVGAERAQTLSAGGISRAVIPVRLVYQRVDDEFLRLAWELTIETIDVDSTICEVVGKAKQGVRDSP